MGLHGPTFHNPNASVGHRAPLVLGRGHRELHSNLVSNLDVRGGALRWEAYHGMGKNQSLAIVPVNHSTSRLRQAGLPNSSVWMYRTQ